MRFEPWLAEAALFGSGRDALVALARWGLAERGWRRVWLPSYSCPEVPAALLGARIDGLDLHAYPDADLTAPARLGDVAIQAADVVVLVNQLGVRARPDVATLRARGAVIVEDHSHDIASPWARESDADYVMVSLRKTLPIPDGGAVWSPRSLPLPPEPEPPARSAKLASALASRSPDERPDLRYLALARAAAGSDEPTAGAPISPVSRALLPQMPVEAWRDRRRENIAILADTIAGASGVRALGAPDGGVAFALTLVFDDAARREAVRQALIARAVVPAVLWPLDAARDWGAGPEDADLAARILSIHADQRFSADDMRRLAVIVGEALTR